MASCWIPKPSPWPIAKLAAWTAPLRCFPTFSAIKWRYCPAIFYVDLPMAERACATTPPRTDQLPNAKLAIYREDTAPTSQAPQRPHGGFPIRQRLLLPRPPRRAWWSPPAHRRWRKAAASALRQLLPRKNPCAEGKEGENLAGLLGLFHAQPLVRCIEA